ATCVSVGSGSFAPTALTEETEAAGLSRLTIEAPLKAEGGRSASVDVTLTLGPLMITGPLCDYHVADPAVVDRATYTLATLSEPTTTAGIESVATYRRGARRRPGHPPLRPAPRRRGRARR